jgi:hypothetical protein
MFDKYREYQRLLLRGLALGYLFIGLFWGLSSQVPTLNVLWFGVAVLLLATPAMLALWYQATVRSLLAIQQFRVGSFLHWLGGRRFIVLFWRSLIAIFLSAVVLLQSVFFKPLEWILLLLAPVLFLLIFKVTETRSESQFSGAAFGKRWCFGFSVIVTTAALVLAWLLARSFEAQQGAQPLLERAHELQSRWSQAPSAIVRWTLDAGALGQAVLESTEAVTAGTWWRKALLVVIAPVSVFGFMALSLAGLALPSLELRRVFAAQLTTDSSPPNVGPTQAAVWAAVCTVVAIALFQLFGSLDHRLRASDSPLALKALPSCERIDGKVYALNTYATLTTLLGEVQKKLSGYQTIACSKLIAIEEEAAKGVDAYLDWYFSLGADWLRFAALMSGDVDVLLEAKFTQLVMARPELTKHLPAVQGAYESQWVELVGVRARTLEVLEKNSLVLDERSCKLTQEHSMDLMSSKLAESRSRLVGGAGAGLITGALAAKVTAKALTKTSMKTASKVLAKVATKKVLSKGASAAAGAVAGAAAGSAVPVLGTVVGAAVGAGAGLAMSATIDMTALMLEEKVSRADMRKELLQAVKESLQPYRETFACSSLGSTAAVTR